MPIPATLEQIQRQVVQFLVAMQANNSEDPSLGGLDPADKILIIIIISKPILILKISAIL